MYNSEHPKLLRNTTPIRDPEVISFVKTTDTNNFLFNALQNLELKDTFLNEYFNWVQSSKLNNLKGLKNLKIFHMFTEHHRRLTLFMLKIRIVDLDVLREIFFIIQ